MVPGPVVPRSGPSLGWTVRSATMSDDETSSTQVSVYIYDLTAGLAQTLSQALLGE